MQFIPSTWDTHGTDGNGDGALDIVAPATNGNTVYSFINNNGTFYDHMASTVPSTGWRVVNG